MPPETDNLRLEELFAGDQKDRETVLSTAAQVENLRTRDLARRKEVFEMMSQGQVNTVNDLYRAAVIMLHGAEPKEFLAAHRLAVMASVNGHKPARWLSAASLDRFLMSIGLPQTYGTQFEHNADDGRYQLRLPIDDSTLLHFEKRFFNVPAVIERLAQLNRKQSS
ncbi:MAG: hypothetical protein SF051_08495 [Elusimicrobiota bacterium]|nr:hypothetical protein [Elusimicrobiota bacterium]